MPRKRRKRKKKEKYEKHQELEEQRRKEPIKYTQLVEREEQLAYQIKRLKTRGRSISGIAKRLKVTKERVAQVRETELYESIKIPARPIKKNLWVHPIQGWEKYRARYRRYLCITDPYEDPEEWAEQLKFWKEKQELELKGPKKMVRVLYFLRINHKHSPKKVRLLQKGKQFTFPIECLVRNNHQKRFDKPRFEIVTEE